MTNYQREYVKYDFYFPSEQLMKKVFADNGIELHYVSPHYYNPKKKSFSEHVEIGKKDMEIVKKEYTPDILWIRTSHALYHMEEMFADADFVVTPSMRLKKIESDKYQVYRFLEKYQPKTSLLTAFYFYPWLQNEFANRLVVKPLSGSGGYGIQFYDKKDLLSMEAFQDYAGTEALHLVQEYKNFSEGAPGLVEGNHDLRVCFLGEKPTFSIIREPKK
ncbi:MAG: hypothetical protein H6765_00045 [Candidatus Peribacteria bacterium]|nr:MAG: hypothetical protein H6765_00045 [Candidatus Peribacteria bacterium]